MPTTEVELSICAMKNEVDKLRQGVWLMRGIRSTMGALCLSRGILSLRCFGAGQLWGFQLRKLERELAVPGLAARLQQNLETQLFAVPVADCCCKWPWYYFSASFVVYSGNCSLRVFFSPPRHYEGGFNSIADSLAGSSRGKQWRVAINDVIRNNGQDHEQDSG